MGVRGTWDYKRTEKKKTMIGRQARQRRTDKAGVQRPGMMTNHLSQKSMWKRRGGGVTAVLVTGVCSTSGKLSLRMLTDQRSYFSMEQWWDKRMALGIWQTPSHTADALIHHPLACLSQYTHMPNKEKGISRDMACFITSKIKFAFHTLTFGFWQGFHALRPSTSHIFNLGS